MERILIVCFSGCERLTSIPLLDTSNGTHFSCMFEYCYKLTSIPQLNTSNGTNFNFMFIDCNSLTSIPLLDTSNGTEFGDMFMGCYELTNLGGFKGLKADLSLSDCTKLTHESLMNVINNLADCTELGTHPTLTLARESYEKLTTDELAIATSKGWTVEIW